MPPFPHNLADRLTQCYAALRLAVVGDFCLDRYLEIDPARQERSIETGRPVQNVIRVRSQPGAAGTVLNNLVALGVGTLYVVGYAGADGEGFELRRALGQLPGVRLDHFIETDRRRTFTYCKPLVIHPDRPPEELDRLDSKNWTPTPPEVERQISDAVNQLAERVDAMIVMDQVDVDDTGVVTRAVRRTFEALSRDWPDLLVLADSRRGLGDYPPLTFKMNRTELMHLMGTDHLPVADVRQAALALARKNGRAVFVTLSEDGIIGARPDGEVAHVPTLPVRGPIDIVGAGDSVTANLTAALASKLPLTEALTLAMAAASVVVHQLGTTGTATPAQIEDALRGHGD